MEYMVFWGPVYGKGKHADRSGVGIFNHMPGDVYCPTYDTYANELHATSRWTENIVPHK